MNITGAHLDSTPLNLIWKTKKNTCYCAHRSRINKVLLLIHLMLFIVGGAVHCSFAWVNRTTIDSQTSAAYGIRWMVWRATHNCSHTCAMCSINLFIASCLFADICSYWVRDFVGEKELIADDCFLTFFLNFFFSFNSSFIFSIGASKITRQTHTLHQAHAVSNCFIFIFFSFCF